MKYKDLILIFDPDVRIYTGKNKKYTIYDTDKNEWGHFGSTMEDYTFHRDLQRRLKLKPEIGVGVMQIFIQLLMLHIIYFGENDRQYYYFFI
jgi:hypothetical protein